MKVVRDESRKNLYIVSEIDDVVKDVMSWINERNSVKFDNSILYDLFINMLAFRLSNLVFDKVEETKEYIMTAPIIKVPYKELLHFDLTIKEDLFFTCTTIQDGVHKVKLYSLA